MQRLKRVARARLWARARVTLRARTMEKPTDLAMGSAMAKRTLSTPVSYTND